MIYNQIKMNIIVASLESPLWLLGVFAQTFWAVGVDQWRAFAVLWVYGVVVLFTGGGDP